MESNSCSLKKKYTGTGRMIFSNERASLKGHIKLTVIDDRALAFGRSILVGALFNLRSEMDVRSVHSSTNFLLTPNEAINCYLLASIDSKGRRPSRVARLFNR